MKETVDSLEVQVTKKFFKFVLLSVFLLLLTIWLLVLMLTLDSPIDSISDNWIILPLSFIAAFFANATAVGGGFLFVPMFILIFGLTPEATLRLSLATQAVGMTSGSIGWSARYINLKMFTIASISGAIGMFLGMFYLNLTSTEIKMIFVIASILVLYSFYIEKRSRPGSVKSKSRFNDLTNDILLVVLSLVGGLITSAAAIGIGEIVAIGMLVLYRIKLEECVGTGVAVLAALSILATIYYGLNNEIPLEYFAFTAPGVAIGGFCGARFARGLKEKGHDSSIIKKMIITIVSLDIVVMTIQIGGYI